MSPLASRILAAGPHRPAGASREAVIRLAKALRAGHPQEASGRCLFLSLEMAKAALARGMDLDLVVWSVVGDPQFLDHWAVAISDTKVIDLTRVQVDGKTGLLYDIGAYPGNFVRRRHYPASLLTPALAANRPSPDGQCGARFLCTVRWRMFKHDLRRSAASGDPAAALRLGALLAQIRAGPLHAGGQVAS